MGFWVFSLGHRVRFSHHRWFAGLILALFLGLSLVPVAQAFLGAFVPYVLRIGAPAMQRAVGVFFKRETGKLVAQPLTKSLEVHGSVVAALGLSAFNWPNTTEEIPRVEICHTGPDGRCTDDLGSGGGSAAGGPSDDLGSVIWMDAETGATFANTDPDRFDDVPSEVDPLQPAAKSQVPKPAGVGETAPGGVLQLYNALLAAGGARDYDAGAGDSRGVATYVATGPLPEYRPNSSNVPCSGPAADVPPGEGYSRINCYGNSENAYSLWRSPVRVFQCPDGYESFGSTACALRDEYEVKKSEARYPCQVAWDGEKFRKDDKNPECASASSQLSISADGQTVTAHNGASGENRASIEVKNHPDGSQTVTSKLGSDWSSLDLGPYDSSAQGRYVTGQSSGTGGGSGTGGSGTGGNGDGSGSGSGSGVDLGEDPGIGEPSLETVPGASEILAPFFTSFWPELRDANFGLSGACPIISFDALETHFEARGHCDYLEQNAGMIEAFMLAAWAMLSLGIVLRA